MKGVGQTTTNKLFVRLWSLSRERGGWQSPLTRNMDEEEHGEGFVPTAKEFGKNGGNDGRERDEGREGGTQEKYCFNETRYLSFTAHSPGSLVPLLQAHADAPLSGYWMHGREAEDALLSEDFCSLMA